MQSRRLLAAFFLCGLGLLFLPSAHAQMVLGRWTPIFKGVDHVRGTNNPTSGYPSYHVINAVRVDLTDPDIQLFTDQKLTNGYIANLYEVVGYTVSEYLTRNKLQVAINANRFDPSPYYPPPGTKMDINGLCICTGSVTSAQSSSASSRSLVFDKNNVPELIYTNWPARATTGIWNAISGDYNLVIKGVNVGKKSPVQDQQPRTAYGISQDKRYLFSITIDGRQPGYSDGAYDYETAAWLILLGAYDGMNVDGGGSTTMVMEDSTGKPLRLNSSSAVADSGRERTIASHLGIYAKPVPGFINDLTVTPDDKTASVSWVTTAPATTQVEYGLDQTLGTFTDIDSTLSTNHLVTLTGLTPNTPYYFRAISVANNQEHSSPVGLFTTTNYVTTNILFEITNSWKYNWINLSAANWTTPGYDDSAWSGPSPALLWVDTRAGGPLGGVDPRNTQMPNDPSTAFPYSSYYFRTHFTIDQIVSGMSLLLSAYIDDGAVFYLNGNEVLRLRMEDAPAVISYTSLATGYPCAGDATSDCLDSLELPATATAHLVAGDNVLAVEVHNYNARSPDITFGAALSALVPIQRSVRLSISNSTGQLVLSWEGSGFSLQQAPTVTGPWSNAPGPYSTSPYQGAATGSAAFYRLVKQ